MLADEETPDESDPTDGVSDAEVAEVRDDAIDRAERTLDIQRERFDRIDEKASKILRFSAVLSGTVFALLGLGPGFGNGDAVGIGTVSASTAVALTAAGIGFVGSVLFAASTYVTTRFGSSFSLGSLNRVIETRVERDLYRALLLNSYREAIRTNRPEIRKNNRRLVATICLLVLSVTGLTVGAGILLVDPPARFSRAIVAVAAVGYVGFAFWTIAELSGRQ